MTRDARHFFLLALRLVLAGHHHRLGGGILAIALGYADTVGLHPGIELIGGHLLVAVAHQEAVTAATIQLRGLHFHHRGLGRRFRLGHLLVATTGAQQHHRQKQACAAQGLIEGQVVWQAPFGIFDSQAPPTPGTAPGKRRHGR